VRGTVASLTIPRRPYPDAYLTGIGARRQDVLCSPTVRLADDEPEVYVVGIAAEAGDQGQRLPRDDTNNGQDD
jgi:hypothetical protein